MLTAYLFIHIFLFGQHTLYEPNKAIAGIELLIALYGVGEAGLHWISQARKHTG